MSKDGQMMAWNEPGGEDKKNPWRKDEGPPDLDELLKKWFKKINTMFGGGDGQSPPLQNFFSGGIFVLILGLVYVFAGVYTVQPQEEAVIVRFGKYNRLTGPGIHWLPRFIEDKYVVSKRENTSHHGGLMLTRDENIISAEINIQYRVDDVRAYLFNIHDTTTAMKQAADSILREAIGQSDLDYLLTSGRELTTQRIAEDMQKIMDSYQSGLFISDIAIQSFGPPDEVKAAFNDVTSAREERERLINKASAYRNERLPAAQASAKRILEEAKAYRQEKILVAQGNTQRFRQMLPEYLKAKEFTERRLYLETMEDILSKTSKVVMFNDNGGVVYLPIEKILEQTKKQAEK